LKSIDLASNECIVLKFHLVSRKSLSSKNKIEVILRIKLKKFEIQKFLNFN
jgi:hypothetical protein